MLFYFNHIMQAFLLPPGCIIFLGLLGLLLYRVRLGKVLTLSSFFILWLVSTPIVAQKLIDGLQNKYPPLLPNQLKMDKNAAIVVLEAGLTYAPEYEKPIVTEATLSRIRYAAFLYRKTEAPILVSGNDPSSSINQADFMADALKEYFNVPTKWKEDRGYNTALEGIYSAEILKKAGIEKIYLVTSAYHMPRSMYSFKNRGFEVIPSPTGRWTIDSFGTFSSFLPSLEAMEMSFTALHEYVGLVWYKTIYHFKG